jgi:hypothetical protein
MTKKPNIKIGSLLQQTGIRAEYRAGWFPCRALPASHLSFWYAQILSFHFMATAYSSIKTYSAMHQKSRPRMGL